MKLIDNIKKMAKLKNIHPKILAEALLNSKKSNN